MGREAGGAWVTHVAAVYEQHSVSADLLGRPILFVQHAQHRPRCYMFQGAKKTTQEGGLKGRAVR